MFSPGAASAAVVAAAVAGSYMEVGLATLIIVVLFVCCHDTKHMHMRSPPPKADVGGLVETGWSRMAERPSKEALRRERA